VTHDPARKAEALRQGSGSPELSSEASRFAGDAVSFLAEIRRFSDKNVIVSGASFMRSEFLRRSTIHP
jgi:hypothetical protein